MASIPNLSTLRTGRRGPRRRGGLVSGLESDNGSSSSNVEAARDKIIQQTDHDASSSRMSAVSFGYLEDDFASALYTGVEIPKRYPIINRGTYVRTKAIDELVLRFLRTDPSQRKQIISLGAGSDTRFFRIWNESTKGGISQVDYHELDFQENINRKRELIRGNPDLSGPFRAAENDGWNYLLNAVDLRDLVKKSPPAIPNLKPDLPTLLLSECCLCYLPPECASSLIQYFTMHLEVERAMVLYEPIRPFDAFGETMVSNLGSRGIHLQTLKRYSTLAAQRQRLRSAGFDSGQGARDVQQLWKSDQWTSQSERDRVHRLEWLDEIEEWQLLASHYCVAWGWKGEVFGKAWEDLDGGWTTTEAKDDDMS